MRPRRATGARTARMHSGSPPLRAPRRATRSGRPDAGPQSRVAVTATCHLAGDLGSCAGDRQAGHKHTTGTGRLRALPRPTTRRTRRVRVSRRGSMYSDSTVWSVMSLTPILKSILLATTAGRSAKGTGCGKARTTSTSHGRGTRRTPIVPRDTNRTTSSTSYDNNTCTSGTLRQPVRGVPPPVSRSLPRVCEIFFTRGLSHT
mmetsp:Transcript_3827/g.10763  ORF Transcript_3827/g.10763 Transcript_3827/m.10763 type:complete len:203 (-) Transcript_3827:1371-1979(-)